MNKTYRLIWNELTRSWIAVAEIVKARGKRASRAALLVAPLVAVSPAPTFAQAPPPAALPAGGQVVAGSASIAQSGATMNITQSTQRAAIDWQTFNVGSGATVNFIQPSSSAVTLNRVLSGNPSQIFGQINATGQVFLTNPGGVYFAPGSSVNVGALVATTHRIGTDDFMAGRDHFTRNGATGSVVNEGTLTAELGGYIALLAPEVRNEGVVVAQLGTVALAAGEAYTLQFAGDRLAGIQVEPATLAALVDNGHAVEAPGGLILLSARAAENLQGSIVNSGRLEASSLTEVGGVIRLEADDILLAAGSQLDASGATGGGAVLVGGDWQGGANEARRVYDDPDALHEATTVTMQAGARIDVSATKVGAGGTAVLWSDVAKAGGFTQMDGAIRATGAGGGTGGKVETSGHVLGVSGMVNAGAGGEWLLDPVNITIANSGGQVTPTNIVNALNAGTSVTIDTTGTGSCTGGVTCGATGNAGDIAVNNSIVTGAMANDATLTLKAYRNITMAGNTTIDATQNSNAHKLNVVFQANASDSDGTGAGSITLGTEGTAQTSIKTNGGDIILGGGSDIATGYAIGYAAGVATENGIRMYRPTLLSDGGNIVIRGKSKPGADGTNGVLIEGRGGAWTIDSGTGTVAITGISTGTGTNFASGVRFNYQAGTLKSAAESADAIRIFGDASATSGNGTRSDGVTLENATTIAATGTGGGIRIEGIGTSNSCSASQGCFGISDRGSAKLLANGGPIELTASGGVAPSLHLTGTVGYAAGTDVTASSSAITLTADSVNLDGSTIQSSGALTVQPFTNSTNIGVGTGTGTLLLPTTYWSGASSIFKDGFSSITIGRASGSGTINADGATIFNDPVTLQTNGNINLAGSIVGNGGVLEVKAGGDITLKGRPGTTSPGNFTANQLSLSGARILTESEKANKLNGTSVLTLTADQLVLNSLTEVDGAGTLHVQPLNPSRPIDIGTFTTDASRLQLPQSYFSRHGTIGIFDDGFSQIIVGRSDGGGDISLNGLSFGDSLTIQSPADAAKATLAGTITTSQNTDFGGSLTVKVGGDIEVSAGSLITTHNTKSSVAGHGSVVLHAGANGNGSIQVLSGANINAAGNLTLGGGSDLATGYATGSASTGTQDRGIYLDNAQLTAGIDLTLRGRGWQGGSAAENPVGIDLRNGSILKAEGDGKITLDGLGGNGTGISNGINIQGSTITSSNGAMSLTGVAGASGSRRAGIGVDTGSSYIYARGFPAPISLTGTGSNATDSEGISSSGTGGTLTVGTNDLGNAGPGTTGQMTLTADTMNLAGMTFYPKAQTRLRVQPLTAGTTIGIAGGAGTLQLPASYFVDNFLTGPFVDDFSYLTVGNENAGDITIGGATSISYNTKLVSGGNIRIDGDLTVFKPDVSKTLVLSGGNGSTVSGTGNLHVWDLILDGSRGADYVLNTATNNQVRRLAASAGSAGIRFYNNRALNIRELFDDSNESGAGITVWGISSNGKIDIATQEGLLEVSRNITTTDASADAIVLNAGRGREAGDRDGGDISRGGAVTISTGAGGRAVLYTGRISGSIGVGSYAGAGNSRYNSDEVTTNYTEPLGDTGIYAIYREGKSEPPPSEPPPPMPPILPPPPPPPGNLLPGGGGGDFFTPPPPGGSPTDPFGSGTGTGGGGTGTGGGDGGGTGTGGGDGGGTGTGGGDGGGTGTGGGDGGGTGTGGGDGGGTGTGGGDGGGTGTGSGDGGGTGTGGGDGGGPGTGCGDGGGTGTGGGDG
ncbi:MAG: filamentous hemagglutinin N-terminal domain-containing protein, partial [Azospira sp.]|nr:filamentous hemagglutinin N-terminal domain-containing protein [Azospira sp.]